MSLFEDGHVGSTMETAEDFSAWDGTAGTPAVSVAQAHHGSNSAEITCPAWGSENIYVTIGTTYPTLFGRIEFYPDNFPSSGEATAMAFRSHPNLYWLCFVEYDSTGQLRLRYRDNGGYSNSDWTEDTLTADDWNCLELEVSASTSSAEYRLWLNDSLVVEVTGKDSDDEYVRSWYVGQINSISTAMTQYIDCFVCDDSRIYCESSGCPIPVAMHHLSHHIFSSDADGMIP